MRANERLESGGGFVPSRLRTTAGAPASYGRVQLLTRLQVHELGRLRPEVRAALGVRDADLAALDGRGQAALAWFDAVVSGRRRPSVPPEVASEVRALARAHDWDAIVARHGRRFAVDTGLPPGELANLARTRQLVGAASRVGAGVPVARVRASLDLGPLAARLGPDVDHYLRRGALGEHRNGWYTRAAMSEAEAWSRFAGALESGGDRVTSRARQVRDFRTARALVMRLEGVEGLPAAERARLIADTARIAHGGDLRALVEASPGRKLRTAAEFASAVDEFAASERGRSLRRFRGVLSFDTQRGVRA